MQVIMGDTLNLIGQLNPEFAQEIFEDAQKDGTIHTILDKDGKSPKYFYLDMKNIDMVKFGELKNNMEELDTELNEDGSEK
mgnify:CR=1 FL=1|jgi:hypothetical protein